MGAITKEVMKEGTTFVVYQHSRPAFEIHPITSEISLKKKKKKSYTMKDLEIFTFSSNCPRSHSRKITSRFYMVIKMTKIALLDSSVLVGAFRKEDPHF